MCSVSPALHFHHKKKYIRTEYHSLKKEINVDQTYYIDYKFLLGVIEQSLDLQLLMTSLVAFNVYLHSSHYNPPECLSSAPWVLFSPEPILTASST